MPSRGAHNASLRFVSISLQNSIIRRYFQMKLLVFKNFRDRLPKEKSKEELHKRRSVTAPEKKDYPAMLIAACVTIVPFVLLLAGLIFGAMWLMFGR